jgi:DNA-binding NarL/FixJ family response regulator
MARLLIADDHWVVRHALRTMLARRPDLEIAGEATTGPEVLKSIRRVRPNLIILDISLPLLSGMRVLQELSCQPESPGILVFTMHAADQYLEHVYKLGAKGYLTKDVDADTIINTIDFILAGEWAFTPAQTMRLKPTRHAAVKRSWKLSTRESEVLTGLLRGERSTSIAERLGISAKSVGTYRLRILEKMAVSNNAELIALAIQMELI